VLLGLELGEGPPPGIDLRVGRREKLALTGPGGAGTSSVLALAMNLRLGRHGAGDAELEAVLRDVGLDHLLLDEPTAHLDEPLAVRLLDLLAGQDRAVLLVTHRPEILDARWRVVDLQAPA